MFDLFSAAMFAGLLQNMIFTGGFGITEAVRTASKPRPLALCGCLTAFYSLSLTAVCLLFDKLPGVAQRGRAVRMLLYVCALAAVYAVSLLAARLLRRSGQTQKLMGVCAFNTLVLSLPFISSRSAFSSAQAIGTALGGAAAYVVAVLLLGLGVKKLSENTTLPEAFRGSGALFVYAAVLSLAFAGITGARIAL